MKFYKVTDCKVESPKFCFVTSKAMAKRLIVAMRKKDPKSMRSPLVEQVDIPTEKGSLSIWLNENLCTVYPPDYLDPAKQR